MINNRIFRAADTTSALEKVQDALGPDAFIIDIRNVGTFVEITASLEEPIYVKKDKFKTAHSSLNSAREKLQNISASANGTSESENVSMASDGVLSDLIGEPKNGLACSSTEGFQPSAIEKLQNRADGHTNIQMESGEATRERKAPEVVESENSENWLSGVSIKEDRFIHADDASKKYDRMGSYLEDDKDSIGNEFSFGDLLNFGFSTNFIKNELNVAQFGDTVHKDIIIKRMVSAFFDPQAGNIPRDYSNFVFLGPPGSGKSTICAKIMLLMSRKNAQMPTILHVTPEKLFEADRLQFHSKLFNLSYYRKNNVDSQSICKHNNQLVEIAWDFQPAFLRFFETQYKLYPQVKPLLVLPAEINHATLKEVFKICPTVPSIILNKADYGRIPIKNLMLIYHNRSKIVAISGERMVNLPIRFCDEDFLSGFVEYTFEMASVSK